MKVLTRADILAIKKATALPIERIDVPEWNNGEDVSVLVRGMTMADEDVLVHSRVENKADDEQTARLCSLCMVDDTGARLFSEADIAWIKTMPPAGLRRIRGAIMRLSGYGAEETTSAEDALKKS